MIAILGRPAAFATLGLAAALLGTTATVVTHDAGAATPSSAVTKSGDAAFPGLEVTVSKTVGLSNEVVEVSWKGGRPTEPFNSFFRNYMQLMQCWGDAADGPRPEQCQYGAGASLRPAPGAGSAVAGRLVRGGSSLPVDPAETHAPDPVTKSAYVPFESADGRKVGGTFDEFNVFFDQSGSNDFPGATIRGDGTGQAFFEVQTAAEAPGLGCGLPVGTAKTPRSCWLVVVPRSDVEVDGSVRRESNPDAASQKLQTSPLSASNWAHRMLFPLSFQPVGGSCALGDSQTPILGHENATGAISGWQQSLCTATSSVFDFAQVPEDAARTALSGSKPLMSVLSKPPAKAPGSGAATYAPIAVSGFGLAYALDVQVKPTDAPQIRSRAGQRVTDLKLTQRLVAKLLTQSYGYGVTVRDPVAKNPLRMEDDPEFLDLNPDMRAVNRFAAASIFTVITPLTPSDATASLWQWIGADHEARDFLAGKPDPHGMIVNPAYKEMDLARSDFPKLDQTCRPPFSTSGPLCVPDAFPYSNDMHESTRSASQGDTLARISWDDFSSPPVYKKSNTVQAVGQRAIMVVADTASAAKFKLPMAQLRNASGKFVAPTAGSMLAAVAAMKPSTTPGVLAPNPTAKGDNVYPLTVVSYAATVPAALTAKDRAAYSAFIDYAAGPGQDVSRATGGLPDGYAPLPRALATTATIAAKAIKNYKPTASKPQPTPKPAKSSTGGSTSGAGGGTNAGSSGGSPTAPSPTEGSGAPAVPPADVDPGAVPPEVTPPVPSPTVPANFGANPVSALTPSTPVGGARLVLVWLLVIGAFAAILSQALPRLRSLQSLPASPARARGSHSAEPGGPGPSAPHGGDAGA